MVLANPIKPKTQRQTAPSRVLSQPEKAAVIAEGHRVLTVEATAIQQLSTQLDERFADACDILLNCEGRVIVMGMGKSGQIGKKIAATLASTGTPAFFV